MEPAKSLIRTTVRSFLPQGRSVLMIDALFAYSVLHVDQFVVLLNTQPREIRRDLNLLLAHRLVAKATRAEARIGATRAVQREYYYINIHDAVDAIKYRIVKLLEKVKDTYSEDQTKRKDWSCPRCKAEYDEYDILDKVSNDGFYCSRCGEVLEQNETAVRERGDHVKIRQINDQLRPFQTLIAQIDTQVVPSSEFEEAWERKREIPRSKEHAGAGKAQYVTLDRPDKNDVFRRQEVVSADNMKVTIATETEREKEDAEAKRKLAEQNARKNVLPEWHTKSAIGDNSSGSSIKKEDGGVSPLPGVKAEEDEKKGSILEDSKMQDDLDLYMQEMERERLQQEKEEAEDDEEEEEEEEEEDDFEDVVGTPINSQQQNGKVKQELLSTATRLNGIKREIDADGDSVSGTDTGANTPMHNGPSSAPDSKRVKLANGNHAPAIKIDNADAGSDEDDEEEFEDV